MKKVLIIALLIFSATALQAQWGSFNGVITTNPITDIDFETATANGTIALETGDDPIEERGFLVSTATNPTHPGDINASETGNWDDSQEWTYDLTLSGLNPNQVYYVKAYMVDDQGTLFEGNEVSFATIPTLGEWGLIALGSLVALFGGWFVYRKFV
jgi:hypothetical protein